MRSRAAFPVVAMMSIAVMVVVAGVVLWPIDTDSDAGPGPVILETLPTAPSEMWKLTARDALGSGDRQASLRILEETDDVLVIEGTDDSRDRFTTLARIDARTGRLLWSERGIDHWQACASHGTTLACVRTARSGDAPAIAVELFDLRTGERSATEIIDAHGQSSIEAVADGFVVSAAGDSVPVITHLSPTGERSWSVAGRPGEAVLRTASGSGLFVMQGTMRGDFSVYRVDTGRRVHSEASSTEPACTSSRGRTGRVVCVSVTTPTGVAASFIRPDYVLYEGGFAVDQAGGEPVVEFYDESGRTTAMQPLDARRIAVVTDSLEPGDQMRRTWRVVDAETGATETAVTTRFGRWLFGYDGRRLIFAGHPASHQRPNVPRLAAYDASSGERLWQIDPVDPHDESARWELGSRRLYLVGAVGYGPGWIARDAS
ncbi:PQQ-binding-like beta-propeller repeat protein [Gordonia phthalatica]|nr:PQQ-binding-like beta-propeller repeat protein [Gordonia phthalatica]